MYACPDPNRPIAPLRRTSFQLSALALAAGMLLAPAMVAAQAAAGTDDEVKAPVHEQRPWPDDLSQPPDGNWLVDEDGLEFFTFELPKAGLRYQRVNEETIRIARGPHLRIAGETDDSFTVKIINNKSVKVPTRQPDPTEEEKAAAAVAYQVSVPEVDHYTFVPVDKGLPRTGLWRNGFDIADMNGDGHLDLVHGPARKSGGVPTVFLGDGAGNWQPWMAAQFPEAPYDYGDVVAADWNNDGKMDLGLAFHTRGLLALVGDGKGGFKIWSEGIGLDVTGVPTGRPPFSSRAVDAVDWDGDGLTDLVALSEGPRGFEHINARTTNGLVFYRNLGDGTWTRYVDEKSSIFGDKLSVADVDGDGKPEVVTSTNYAGERGLVNRWIGGEPGWQSVLVDAVRPSALIWSSATGDFDGDGREDLALGYRNRQLGVRRMGIDVLLSRQGGVFERRPVLVSEQDQQHLDIHALAIGDVDGDGDRDLVATTRNGQLFLFLGDGKGGFVREVEPVMEKPLAGCRGYGLEVADVVEGMPGGEIIASFSGETCPNGGSIRAWRLAPKSAAPAPPAPVPAAPEPAAGVGNDG